MIPGKQLILYLSELLASMSFTILASFYPGIAVEKGISLWMIGLIFSIDPIIGLPTSLAAGKYMNLIGRRAVLIFGMLLGAFSLLLIAFVEEASYLDALILSFLSRTLAGIGAGCSMTAAPSILVSEYPLEIEKVIGIFEAASGLGLLVGPLFGSLISLYRISISFTLTAILYLIFTIASFFIMRNLNPPLPTQKSLSLIALLTKPKILINFLPQLWLLFVLGYLSTSLELHLKSFGLSTSMAALGYSLCTLTYFLTSLFEYQINKCFKAEIVIFIGIILTGISFILIGPFTEIFPDRLEVSLTGLGILGFAGSIMYSKLYIVPATSNLILISVRNYKFEYSSILIDSISALTNFSSNIGEITGPLVAGFLGEYLGIADAFNVIGVCSIALALVYLLVSFIGKAKVSQISPESDRITTSIANLNVKENHEMLEIQDLESKNI